MKKLFCVLGLAFLAVQIHAIALEIDANAVLSSEASYSYNSYLGDGQVMSAKARQTIGSSPLGLEVTVSVPFFSMSKFAYGMSVDTGCSVSRSFKQEDKNNLTRFLLIQNSSAPSLYMDPLVPYIVDPYDDNEIPLDDNPECVNTNLFAAISPMIRFSPSERHSITISPGILLEATISRSTGKLAYAPVDPTMASTNAYTIVRRSEQVVTMDYAANLGISYKYWFLMKKYFKMGLNAGVNLMVPISGSVIKTGGYSTTVYELNNGDKINGKLLVGLAFNFGERNNVGSSSGAGGQAGTAGESDCGCKGCKCPYCTGEKK